MDYDITLRFSRAQLLAVIENAHSNYWIGDYRPLYDREAGMLALKPKRGVDFKPGRVQITAEDIANALREMLSYKHATQHLHEAADIRRAATDCLAGMNADGMNWADGPTCDSVLQFAIFGALVYG